MGFVAAFVGAALVFFFSMVFFSIVFLGGLGVLLSTESSTTRPANSAAAAAAAAACAFGHPSAFGHVESRRTQIGGSSSSSSADPPSGCQQVTPGRVAGRMRQVAAAARRDAAVAASSGRTLPLAITLREDGKPAAARYAMSNANTHDVHTRVRHAR